MQPIPQDEGNSTDDDGDDEILPLIKEERWYQTTLQVSIPFFLAGIGTIAAGVLLGHVKVKINFTSKCNNLKAA